MENAWFECENIDVKDLLHRVSDLAMFQKGPKVLVLWVT